jgi:hypothetical protein
MSKTGTLEERNITYKMQHLYEKKIILVPLRTPPPWIIIIIIIIIR